MSKGSHVSYGGRCPCTSSDGSGRSKGRRASRGRGDAAGVTWLEFPVDFGGEFEGKSKNCPIHFLGFKKLLRTIIYINLLGIPRSLVYRSHAIAQERWGYWADKAMTRSLSLYI